MTSEAASNRIEKDGVSVAVDVMKPEETEDVFGADLVRQGTQPLLLMIHNGSAQTYRFRKADVDARYIPAAEAARHAYGNPVVTGGRMIGWAVWHVPAVVFRSVRKGLRRPVTAQDVRTDFLREEIADADIGPQGSIQGFMFVRPLEPGSRITVKLLNLGTQHAVVFEAPVS